MWKKIHTEELAANYSELKSQLQQNSEDIDLQAQLAKCCFDFKKFDEAENLYKELIKKEPSKSKYYYYLGKVYSAQKKWVQAIDQQEQAIKYWPENNWAAFEKAKCMLNIGENGNAIKSLESLLPHLSDNHFDSILMLNIHRLLLKEYIKTKSYEQALLHAEKLAVLDPQDGLNLYYLGKIQQELKNYQEAIRNFEKADKILNKPYIKDKIAICLSFLDRKEEAIEIYSSIPYTRMDDYIHQHYGRLLLDIGDLEGAKKQLKMSLLKKGTSKFNSHFYLGKVFFKLGKYNNALSEFRKANDLRKKEFGSEYRNALDEISNIEKNYEVDKNEIIEDYANYKLGKVKTFISSRGFGFIEYEEGKEIFFHMKNARFKNIHQYQEVKFEIIDGRKGLEAVNILLLDK